MKWCTGLNSLECCMIFHSTFREDLMKETHRNYLVLYFVSTQPKSLAKLWLVVVAIEVILNLSTLESVRWVQLLNRVLNLQA